MTAPSASWWACSTCSLRHGCAWARIMRCHGEQLGHGRCARWSAPPRVEPREEAERNVQERRA